MGLIYTFSVNAFNRLNKESQKVSLANLKEYLLSLNAKKSAKILCLEDCSRCDIFVDDNKTATIENFVDDTIRVYRYEYFQGVQEQMKEVYFNENDIQEAVCFSYEVDFRGVGDQVLVEFKTQVYDYTYYFEATKKYESMQEAIEGKEKLIEEVRR